MANKKTPTTDATDPPKKASQKEDAISSEPIRTALSLYPKASGWVVVEYKIQGDKVISALPTIEDLKAITLEKFKIAAYRLFINPK